MLKRYPITKKNKGVNTIDKLKMEGLNFIVVYLVQLLQTIKWGTVRRNKSHIIKVLNCV